jgi:NAD(P)-dependent dehydrogenase (short-subunit alcohol dehydrogenase family)
MTGGARIGQAVAQELARRGCHLALTYRESRGAADATVAAALELGVRAEAFRADASQETQVAAAVAQAAASLGGIDILINMASSYTRAPLPRLGLAAWSEALDSNVLSAFLFSVKAAPLMKKAGAGRIINFSDWLSASGRPRYEGYTPYYVAKKAVDGLTEALALDLAPDILVNSIAPGPILPPTDLSAEDNAKVIAATPLRRWGGAAEIARAVLFLIETDFVTGECLRVDGGRHLY